MNIHEIFHCLSNIKMIFYLLYEWLIFFICLRVKFPFLSLACDIMIYH